MSKYKKLINYNSNHSHQNSRSIIENFNLGCQECCKSHCLWDNVPICKKYNQQAAYNALDCMEKLCGCTGAKASLSNNCNWGYPFPQRYVGSSDDDCD